MSAQTDLLIAIRAINQTQGALRAVADDLKQVDRAAVAARPSFTAMSGAMAVGTLAAGALATGAAAVGSALMSTIRESASFGQAMANIKATVPKAEFEQFGAQTQALAMRLGKDYPLSATDAGKAMEILAQKGISLANINNGAAESVVQLATATGADLRTGAEIAAVAMDVFNVDAKDMQRVTDLMAGSMLRGGVTATDFGYAIRAGGTAVALAGGTIEDASIAIAAMAKAGIEGSDAGTSLKTMYMNLIPATKGQVAVAKELGLITKDGANQFFDASGKVKSYEEISQVLATSLQGLTEKQKLSALETLFGSDAIRAAAVAAKFGAGEFGNLGDQIRQPGIAADAAKTKLDSLQGQMQQLSGSTETLALKVGNQLAPYLQKAAFVATEFINKLVDMADAVQVGPAIDAVGEALSGLSGFVYDAGQAASSFGEIMGDLPGIGQLVDRGFQIVGSVLTALAAVMRGDGAAAAEALGQAFSDLGAYIETASGIITDAVAMVSDGWTMLVDATTTAYDAVVSAVTAGWDAVTGAIDGAFSAIGGAVSAGWNWAVTAETHAAMADLIAAVGEAWAFVSSAIGDAFGSVVAAVSGGWAQATGETQSAMGQIIGAVESVAGPIVDAVAGFMSSAVATVASFAGEAWSAAASVASNFVAGLRDGINSRVQEIAGAAANMVRAALGAAQSAQESQSPSKKTHKLGQDFVQGFIDAIEEGQMGEAVRVQVMGMIDAFDDYKVINGEIARVEQEIKDIREDAAAAALERGRDMIDLTSEELRLRKELAIAERDLLPARQELRNVQRDIRDIEKGGLPTQERVIAINAQINQLKLQEIGYDRQLIGVDRRSKEAEAITKAKEALNDQVRVLELEKREIELGGKIAADAYRTREAAIKTTVEAGEKELQLIKDVIEQIDAEQKVFKAHEDVVKDATDNEIKARQMLLNAFKNEKAPVQDRIRAGLDLIATMEREGRITKEQADAIRKMVQEQTGAKTAIENTTRSTAAATTAMGAYERAVGNATTDVRTATTATGSYSQALDVLGNKRPNVIIATNTQAVSTEVSTFGGLLDAVGARRPAPAITLPGIATIQQQVNTLNQTLDDVAHPVAIGFSANVPTAVTVSAINTTTETVHGAVNAGSASIGGGLSAAWAAVGGGMSVGQSIDAQGAINAATASIGGNIGAGAFSASNATLSGVGNINANTLDADQSDIDNVDMDEVDMDSTDMDSTDMDSIDMDNVEIDAAETDQQEVNVDNMEVDNFDADVSGKARGGSVRRGGLSLVGEEGPELVAWGADGYVIPNGPSMAMLGAGGGGGATTNITVHVHVAGSVTASRDLALDVRDELIRMGRVNRSIFGE